LNQAYCSETISGFSFECEFSAQGYKFTALPSDGGAPLVITTGGVLSDPGQGQEHFRSAELEARVGPQAPETQPPEPVVPLAARNALAKSTLRSLSVAAETYAVTHSGNYPTAIGDLTNAVPPFINRAYCGEQIDGYSYACSFRP
jgi:hypothetical protein